jgi:hypothetical protein
MAVKMAVVKNLVTVKGLQVALNSGEGGSEGLPRSGNTAVYPLHYMYRQCRQTCAAAENIFRFSNGIRSTNQPNNIGRLLLTVLRDNYFMPPVKL